MKIPIDLDGITDGTALDIDIALFAEADAPGGETRRASSCATRRMPPTPTRSSISITTDGSGPVGAVPEPFGLALLAPARLALRFRRRGKGSDPALQAGTVSLAT